MRLDGRPERICGHCGRRAFRIPVGSDRLAAMFTVMSTVSMPVSPLLSVTRSAAVNVPGLVY